MEDDNMSGPAPKTGMLVVCRGTPLVGTGPYYKGGELLKPPNLTTPQGYNAWSPPGGGIELEEASKFTYTCLLLYDASELISSFLNTLTPLHYTPTLFTIGVKFLLSLY